MCQSTEVSNFINNMNKFATLCLFRIFVSQVGFFFFLTAVLHFKFFAISALFLSISKQFIDMFSECFYVKVFM